MEKFLGFERRRKPRRQAERGGKLDRRKNTCGTCQLYKPETTVAGLCKKHQTMIGANDFACVWFTAPLSPETDQ